MSKKCLNGFEMSKVESLVTDFFNSADAVQVEDGTWYYSDSSVEAELLNVYTKLAKANERENRLEKILQRYESEQLQPLKQRVKELESAILDSCSTYHFEPDLSQPVSSLNELLIINSKWTLDPEISSDASKFATEKKIEGVNQFCATLSTWEDVHPIGANYVTSLSSHRDSFNEQLRKEQES